MKRTIALSVLDQAVLSAQSMFVSLLLIWLADAEAVGRFALALSLYFSFLTVQDSLFGSILANRVYGRSVEEQRGTIGMVSTLSLSMMIAAAVLTAAAAAWIGFDAELVMATVAMTVAGMLRELARAVAIALGDMRRCVRVDAAAAVLTCVPLPLLLQMVAPEVACLASIALGHAVATLVFKPRLHVSIGQLPAKITAYRDLLAIAKWSLVAGRFSGSQIAHLSHPGRIYTRADGHRDDPCRPPRGQSGGAFDHGDRPHRAAAHGVPLP